ncbi:PREDICTED: programmed cell death protein 10-A-like [Priapulus caudatus]|uniref:Programmed cell death protein 10-A-like n=1 Tax=Priapulus caudatus TaxID=37621 RepID=A0ABM1EVF5_PRICU|nr:PREDICTED: programmed cell death protein 10-A-like [Priapulus caudatus]
MTMGDESPVIAMALPGLIQPILDKLGKKDIAAAQTLRVAFSKVEAMHPGFTHDLVTNVLQKADVPINMNENMLRLEGDHSNPEFLVNRGETAFKELNYRAVTLKKILSCIPDEINDRKAFLETIKEIASAIKKLLDAVNNVFIYVQNQQGKQMVETRKREFVKYSKRFSNTLKDYFREGQANAVYHSANCLINQTNIIMTTIKHKCE